MKKIAILAVLLFFAASTYTFAASAGSQTGTTYTCSSSSPSWTVSLSKSVTMTYDVTSDHLYYAIAASHNSGDKTYASSSVDTKIFFKNGTGITAPTAASTSPMSGWTAM